MIHKPYENFIKISIFAKLNFWPQNENIGQTFGLNIEDGPSNCPKLNFIIMIHYYDVINLSVYKGISKMNLTRHLSCFILKQFSFTNPLTTDKILFHDQLIEKNSIC